MYLIRGINNIGLFQSRKKTNKKICATIGNFDGFHLGHQEIIRSIKSISKKNNYETLVCFTEPHASEFFAEKSQSFNSPPRIFPWREKVRYIQNNEIDYAFYLKFNDNLRKMRADVFLDLILGKLNLGHLIIGDDFKFGANREGDFELLKSWGDSNNIIVDKTPTFEIDHERVSSSRIRSLLLNDNFIEAKRLLGRPYTFSGKVVYGQQLGRQLDVPTANIWMPKQKLPISGVYAVNVRVEDKTYNGIANMGVRPTVGGTSPVLEVHIFNFSKDIYAKRIEVEFFKKIREEKKFKSIDLLKLQIQKDIEQAKKLLS